MSAFLYFLPINAYSRPSFYTYDSMSLQSELVTIQWPLLTLDFFSQQSYYKGWRGIRGGNEFWDSITTDQ